MTTTIDGSTGIVTQAIDVTTPITVSDGGTGLSAAGSAGNVLVSDGTSWSSASKITTGIAQNTTSGTSVDFTSIPSWAKRITVAFSAVSTNGSSEIQVQIGAGSITNTGYISASGAFSGSSNSSSYTTGFVLKTASASASLYGNMTISLVSGNTWVYSFSGTRIASDLLVAGGGITLSGTLDRIRITTVNGTDTFDAGSVNIMYE